MSRRLKILSGEERIPYPYLSANYLAETLGSSVEGVEQLAKLERWKLVEREFSEFMDNEDTPSDEKVWDGMSMPLERRKLIANNHYRLEEEEIPLATEIYDVTMRIMFLFPEMDLERFFAALYWARQFSMVKDAIQSLALGLYDAFEAISGAFCAPPAMLVGINADLDNGNVCSFIQEEDDTRLVMLVGYFHSLETVSVSNLVDPILPLEMLQ